MKNHIHKSLFVIFFIFYVHAVFAATDQEWRDLVFADLSANMGISVAPGALIAPQPKEGKPWTEASGPLFSVSWATSSMSSKGYMTEGSCSMQTYEYALKISGQMNPENFPTSKGPLWSLSKKMSSATIFGERSMQSPIDTIWMGTVPKQSFAILAELLLADAKNEHQILRTSSERVQAFEKFMNERIGKLSPMRVELERKNYLIVMDGLGISLRKKDNSGTQVLAQIGGDVQNLLSYACAQNSFVFQDADGISICIRQRISAEDGAPKMEERQFSARAAPFWNYLLARFMATEVSPSPTLAAAAAPVGSPVQPTVDIPSTFPAGIETAVAATEKAMSAFAEKYPDLPKPAKSVTHIVRLGETLPSFAQKGELLWQVDMFNAVNSLYCSVWINPQNPLNQGIRELAADSQANAKPWIFILPPIGGGK